MKRLFVVFLIAMVLWQEQQAHAQVLPAAPAANFVMNRAVAGVVTRVAIGRGFAANDPRIAATLTGVGSSLTAVNVASTVAGVGLAVSGAPVWLTIVAGLGVLAVGAAIVAGTASLSLDSTPDGTRFRVNNPAQPTQPYAMPPPGVGGIPAAWSGAPLYRSPLSCFSNDPCYALALPPPSGISISADQAGKYVLSAANLADFAVGWQIVSKPVFSLPPGVIYNYQVTSAQFDYNSTGLARISVNIHEDRSGGDSQGLPSFSRDTNTSLPAASITPGIAPQWFPNLDQAVSSLSAATKSQTVSDSALAQIVNNAWQTAAAQPGYTGVPYVMSNPVTAADIAAWRPTASAIDIPKIDDLIRPANNSGSPTVSISTTVQPNPTTDPTPTPTPGTSTNVNVTNKVSVDLGPDPGIGAPGLEAVPTAQMILNPLLTLFPSLRNFVVPSHSSECPKPSLNVFNREMVMEAHCTLLETVRPTLYAVMAMVWVLIALLVVLAA
jgi:hypothetical protein